MPQAIKGLSVIATKQADGSVNLMFQDSQGGVRFFANLPSADVTAINTSVNGGSTGATKTFSYAQDAGKNNAPRDVWERE